MIKIQMYIKSYLNIKIYKKMSEKFNTSTVVKTCTAVGAAIGLSLYLYFRKDVEEDDEEDDEEEDGYLKSCLNYDMYNKIYNDQKIQRKELLELGYSVRDSVDRLKIIVDNYTTSINTRLNKLEMKNPECSFFDKRDNDLTHIPKQNEFSPNDTLIDTPTNTPTNNRS